MQAALANLFRVQNHQHSPQGNRTPQPETSTTQAGSSAGEEPLYVNAKVR